MSLPLPNLDDRTFADLVAEGRALIPRYAPQWTNYNPSDPGITLLELLAWLTEQLLYRINHIPQERYDVFLNLIGVERRPGETSNAAVERALRALNARTRAVSLADYERLAVLLAVDPPPPLVAKALGVFGAYPRLEDFEVLADFRHDQVARARAVSEENGRISVVILPSQSYLKLTQDPALRRYDSLVAKLSEDSVLDLAARVRANLEPFRVLTTLVAVLPVQLVEVNIDVVFEPVSGAKEDELVLKLMRRISEFLDPYTGGTDTNGWPLGGDVHRSELCQVIEDTAGVNYLIRLALNGDMAVGTIPVGQYHIPSLHMLNVTSRRA
jgi:hypothetical protein